MNITELKSAGINYEEGLKRFSNKAELYQKYLKKFLEDPTMEQLTAFLAQQNYEEAFRCAHSLKGMSGNLSLSKFYKCDCALVEALRHHQLESITQLHQELLSAYNDAKTAIN